MTFAIGIPTVVWCSLGYRDWRTFRSRPGPTPLVLTLVILTGRNMAEVSAAMDARSYRRCFSPPASGLIVCECAEPLWVNRGFTRAHTLALQGLIQVVYPV